MHHATKNNLSIDDISSRRRLPINNSFLFIYLLSSSSPHVYSLAVNSLCVIYATKANKSVAGGDNKSLIAR
jgi:hypothetical protein